MKDTVQPNRVREAVHRISETLGLSSRPVGVRTSATGVRVDMPSVDESVRTAREPAVDLGTTVYADRQVVHTGLTVTEAGRLLHHVNAVYSVSSCDARQSYGWTMPVFRHAPIKVAAPELMLRLICVALNWKNKVANVPLEGFGQKAPVGIERLPAHGNAPIGMIHVPFSGGQYAIHTPEVIPARVTWYSAAITEPRHRVRQGTVETGADGEDDGEEDADGVLDAEPDGDELPPSQQHFVFFAGIGQSGGQHREMIS